MSSIIVTGASGFVGQAVVSAPRLQATIADLDEARWQIEVFFKWLKQNLNDTGRNWPSKES